MPQQNDPNPNAKVAVVAEDECGDPWHAEGLGVSLVESGESLSCSWCLIKRKDTLAPQHRSESIYESETRGPEMI